MTRKIMMMIHALVLVKCTASSGAFPAFGTLRVALAKSSTVTATGNVNIRSDPSLDYKTLTSISAGTGLEYSGETFVDSRGVS